MNPLESIIQLLSRYLPVSREAQQDPKAFAQQLRQPPQVSGDLINELAGTMPLVGGMAKVFKPVTEAVGAKALSYTDKLVAALKSYTNPLELSKLKGRLQPALQYAEGEPNLATNLLTGSRNPAAPGMFATGHDPLYALADTMKIPADIQRRGHGYFDPANNVFLTDSLNTLLYDPKMLKSTTDLLDKGMNLDAILGAFGFAK